MTYEQCLELVRVDAEKLVRAANYESGLPFDGHVGDACLHCIRNTLKALVIEHGGLTVDGLRIGLAVSTAAQGGIRAQNATKLRSLISRLHDDIAEYVHAEVMRRWEEARKFSGTYQPQGEADEVSKFQNEKFRGFD